MTEKEAIKELKILREDYWDEYGDTMPALDMAIKALEQQSEDAISRYGVPHKIAEFFSNWDGDENAKMEISVKDIREISGMFVTKCQAESKLKTLKQSSCEDAISRKETVQFLENHSNSFEDAKIRMAFQVASSLVNNPLPSVYPKPKTGHWIEGKTDNPNIHNILCSCCFEGYPSKGHANSQCTKEKFQWCPKCGARMIDVPDINVGSLPQENEDKE